ncbi:MAG: hypothetical protein UW09_C0002G0027 [candidate division TM6 bacterium GW2011_GWF2_43_87]|nr:MAG: hypothetical protein UW09_C0002G0027 [candidate division TM6 bacterium GW2011_GWF2_43_87]
MSRTVNKIIKTVLLNRHQNGKKKKFLLHKNPWIFKNPGVFNAVSFGFLSIKSHGHALCPAYELGGVSVFKRRTEVIVA